MPDSPPDTLPPPVVRAPAAPPDLIADWIGRHDLTDAETQRLRDYSRQDDSAAGLADELVNVLAARKLARLRLTNDQLAELLARKRTTPVVVTRAPESAA